VGLAVGYGVGMRGQPPAATGPPTGALASLPTGSTGSTESAASASAPTPPAARETTDVAVAQPVAPSGSPGSVPPADAPPAKSADALPSAPPLSTNPQAPSSRTADG